MKIRSLLRNQQPIFFRNLTGQEEILDEFGNSTGSFIPIYSGLKSAMLCVSPNKGNSEVEQFGSLEDYDRTATTADTFCEIDEDSVLWVDGADTDGPYNYIVKRRAPWKNSVQFAIKRVTVSQYNEKQKSIQKAIEKKAEIAARMEAKRHADHQTQTKYGIAEPGVERAEIVSEEG